MKGQVLANIRSVMAENILIRQPQISRLYIMLDIFKYCVIVHKLYTDYESIRYLQLKGNKI